MFQMRIHISSSLLAAFLGILFAAALVAAANEQVNTYTTKTFVMKQIPVSENIIGKTDFSVRDTIVLFSSL